MDIIARGIIAGILGTLMMDTLNHLFFRIGLIPKIEVGMIGRMAAGWTQGRFRYRSPGEMQPIANENFYGVITHYGIGVVLAAAYVLGWVILFEGPVSAFWALIYGVVTTVASWFFVYPSMGLGMLGRLSPDGFRAPLSSLANHLFFGMGMAISFLLV